MALVDMDVVNYSRPLHQKLIRLWHRSKDLQNARVNDALNVIRRNPKASVKILTSRKASIRQERFAKRALKAMRRSGVFEGSTHPLTVIGDHPLPDPVEVSILAGRKTKSLF